MGWSREIEDIHAKRRAALEQGGAEAVARQHAQGRLTVRERIEGLVDPGSFREHGRGSGGAERGTDGALKSFTPGNFIVGMGRIEGRPAVVGGEDFTVRGGSPNAAGLRKSVYIEDLALQYRVPLIRLHEGGGGSVTGAGGSGPVGEAVYAPRRFASVAECMGAVPVATAALGPVAGLPASRLVAAHFAVMARENAQVLIAGPAVVKRALGEDVTKEELGGAQVHARSGAIDNIARDEADALAQIRRFLSYLPQNAWQVPARTDTDDDPARADDELRSIVPENRRKFFNMRRAISMIVDRDSIFEMGRQYGPGQITMLARLNGYPVGVFSNDARFYAGAMTADGARKVRRFIEFCETFNLPIVSFVDEPGFHDRQPCRAGRRHPRRHGCGAGGGHMPVALGVGHPAQVLWRGGGRALRPRRLYPRLALGRNGRPAARRRCGGGFRARNRCGGRSRSETRRDRGAHGGNPVPCPSG